MKPASLKSGDTIGIVAPSRPILLIKREVDKGIMNLRKMGYKIKLGKNLEKRLYYSAGTPKEKADDINSMFRDKKVRAIICATGGSSSNQTIQYLDFDLIKRNPKIFLGYSDITTLLLCLYKKTKLITFHGPDAYEFFHLSKEAASFLFDILSTGKNEYVYPKKMKVLKKGKGTGKLIGGNTLMMNALLGSKCSPDYRNSILFWEAVNLSPAMIDFRLNEFKLSGNFKDVSGMVIGYLSDCQDKKYPEDNRSIEDIVLNITREYKFPIIKVDYFGHDILNFYTFPVGIKASVDTEKKEFKLIETVTR